MSIVTHHAKTLFSNQRYLKFLVRCHPELVSGSHPKGKNEMLNQVQYDKLVSFPPPSTGEVPFILPIMGGEKFRGYFPIY